MRPAMTKGGHLHLPHDHHKASDYLDPEAKMRAIHTSHQTVPRGGVQPALPTATGISFDPSATEIFTRNRRATELEWLVGTGDKYVVEELTKDRASLYRLPNGRLYLGLGRPNRYRPYGPPLNEED